MFKVWKTLLNRKNYDLRKFSNKHDINLSVSGVSIQNYIKHLVQQYENVVNEPNSEAKITKLQLQPVIKILEERQKIVDNIESIGDLINENDEELQKLAKQEQELYESQLKSLESDLLHAITPVDKEDLFDSIVLEINTGVGGQEAMLFANELFEMYCNFAAFKGWQVEIADMSETLLGGIRHASALVTGRGVFRYFKYEAGVHRVQRIPATEKAGRIHTSTVSVLALPQPTEIQINIDNKDLRIESKRASGAGGQHVNTTDSAVRITHLPTGIAVDCQVNRSQIKNKTIAMAKLRALLYQKELDAQIAENQATRKSQVRSNNRNEKIRTYNFPQDRITDHRIQTSVHNLKGFLQGNTALEALLEKMDAQDRLDSLLCILKEFK